jgi:hypothetical protein
MVGTLLQGKQPLLLYPPLKYFDSDTLDITHPLYGLFWITAISLPLRNLTEPFVFLVLKETS